MIEKEKNNLQTKDAIIPSAGFDTIRDHTTDDQANLLLALEPLAQPLNALNNELRNKAHENVLNEFVHDSLPELQTQKSPLRKGAACFSKFRHSFAVHLPNAYRGKAGARAFHTVTLPLLYTEQRPTVP
jgi:hypothetical protein